MLELWKVTGGKDLEARRFEDVASLEDAARVATAQGTGKYYVCDGSGTVCFLKVVRLPGQGTLNHLKLFHELGDCRYAANN